MNKSPFLKTVRLSLTVCFLALTIVANRFPLLYSGTLPPSRHKLGLQLYFPDVIQFFFLNLSHMTFLMVFSENRRWLNVIHLSFVFLLTYASLQTLATLQKLVQKSISDENENYYFDGYVALALSYISYSVFVPLSPVIVSLVNCRASVVLGVLMASLNNFTLISNRIWLTYVLLIMDGVGSSLAFVAENNYIVLNAREDSLVRDYGVFWGIYQLSLLTGSIITVVQFTSLTRVQVHTRFRLFYSLGGISLLAFCLSLFLGQPKGTSAQQPLLGPVEITKKMFQISKTRRMIFFIVVFFYNGLQQAFALSVYPSSVAFTRSLGTSSIQLSSISVIFYTISSSFGGFISPVLSRNTSKCYVYTISVLLQICAFAATYINIPNDASFGTTDNMSLIEPSKWLALLCSLINGLSGGLCTTFMTTALGQQYPDNSCECGALQQFVKGLSGAFILLLNSFLGLHWQLIFLSSAGLISIFPFSKIAKSVK